MNSHKFAEARKNFSPTKFSKYVWMFSGAIILVGIIMFAVMGFNLGMDFTGGNIVRVEGAAQITDAQMTEITNVANDVLREYGLEVATAQHEGETRETVSIQYQNADGAADMTDINNELVTALSEAFPQYTVVNAESKSATTSSELLTNALLAVIIALIFIMIYIAVRFEFLE